MRCARIVIAIGVVASAGLTPLAHATVGGPTTIDVLGWCASERRVYVHEIPHDGAGMFGHVLVFSLDGPPDAPPTEAEWTRSLTREGTAEDQDAKARLAQLRRRLKPMTPWASTALPITRTIVSQDTLRTGMGDVPRFRVRAQFEIGGESEVTTFVTPEVVMHDVRTIPGRREVLVVLAFTGDPFEGGYETQVARVTQLGYTGLRQVEWRHFE